MSTKVIIAVTACLVIGLGLGFMLFWPMINIVETGKTSEYPDIQPLRVPLSKDRVVDGALHAVSQLPHWLLISYDVAKGEVRAEATTSLLRFVDDVVIRVVEENTDVSVHVRSASRVGRGDFGQNARNIRKFFAELHRQLQNPVKGHNSEKLIPTSD